jgi:hypothetical protein
MAASCDHDALLTAVFPAHRPRSAAPCRLLRDRLQQDDGLRVETDREIYDAHWTDGRTLRTGRKRVTQNT